MITKEDIDELRRVQQAMIKAWEVVAGNFITYDGSELISWPSMVEETSNETKSVCECGKDKHGFANHSNWCPKIGD